MTPDDPSLSPEERGALDHIGNLRRALTDRSRAYVESRTHLRDTDPAVVSAALRHDLWTYLRALSRMSPRVLSCHMGLPSQAVERIETAFGQSMEGLIQQALHDREHEDIPDAIEGSYNGGGSDA